jgi:PIN domain nuclease of toxin-antitoxin system
VRLLLDTSAFLWWITNDPKLSATAAALIADTGNTIYLSAATGWEIATKFAIGKLPLPDGPDRYVAHHMQVNGVTELPVLLAHTLHVHTLPFHHKDPFDRILVAQSQVESIPILTADPLIAQYAVTVLW